MSKMLESLVLYAVVPTRSEIKLNVSEYSQFKPAKNTEFQRFC